jgi:hypothetical protein
MEQNTRKYIFSFKDNSKPIVLSDSTEQDINKVADEFSEILKQNSICLVHTKNDCLIAKTQEITSILISDPDNIINNKSSPQIKTEPIKVAPSPSTVKKEPPKQNDYKQKLLIK